MENYGNTNLPMTLESRKHWKSLSKIKKTGWLLGQQEMFRWENKEIKMIWTAYLAVTVLLIILGRKRKRNDTRPRMREKKRIRIHRFSVSRQFMWWSDFALVRAALAAGEEVLAGEDFVNESVLVTVEAENDAAEEGGIGAESGEGVAEGAGGVGGIGAETEVNEEAVGDGGSGGGERGEGREGEGGGGGG
ncbi:hypothetical protein Lal_00010937 [Lupinus albus]|nr:hypothetical protein Lal_00010937 [Lupinus albus]